MDNDMNDQHENESTSRELPDAEDLDDFDDDGLDGLIAVGRERKSPFQFHYIKGGPNDGKLGMVTPKTRYYPGDSEEVKAKRASAESKWEKSALAMHQNQQPLPTLADKPTEIVLKYAELTRGD